MGAPGHDVAISATTAMIGLGAIGLDQPPNASDTHKARSNPYVRCEEVEISLQGQSSTTTATSTARNHQASGDQHLGTA